MGSKERPVYSSKAHVFLLDKETKKNWEPLSGNKAVPLAIYHNPENGTHRIVSFVTEQDIIINSLLTQGMKVTRSSSKFCQFSDSSVKKTFGLGFGNAAEQAKFKEQFEQIVYDLKSKADEKEPAQPSDAEKTDSPPVERQSSPNSTQEPGSPPPESAVSPNSEQKPLPAASGHRRGSDTPEQTVPPSKSVAKEAPPAEVEPTSSQASNAAPPMEVASPKKEMKRDLPGSASGSRKNLLSKLLSGGGSGRDIRDEVSDADVSQPSQSKLESSGDHGHRSAVSPTEITAKGPLYRRDANNREESPQRTAQAQRRPSISGPSQPDAGEQLTQLKKENDQLKIALATSSSRANQWETELQRLKHNNVRLLTTLQESQNNVDEWKKQLTLYKDDNTIMKQKLNQRELAESQLTQLKQETAEWEQTKLEMTEDLRATKERLDKKEEECTKLNADLETMAMLAPKLQAATEKCKELTAAKAELTDKLAETQDQLRLTRTATAIRLERLTGQHKALATALHDLTTVHSQMEQDLQ